MVRVSPFLILAFLFSSSFAFLHKNIYPKPIKRTTPLGNVGEPLFLTPFISEGRIAEAQELCLVQNMTEVISYSGYLTANSTYGSNMFFWFFPAAYNREKAPVLVWLQGGPGGSSLFGLFVENGPFVLNEALDISLRTTSWALTHNVIYFDNPVGTGFSFTKNDNGYARNEEDVARDLYSAIVQFFTLFPEYQSNDFYMTGESYAGKYVPAISYKIHKENQNNPPIRINLKGMAIGDGFSDPVSMLNYGDYLYNVGLLDMTGKEYFNKEEKRARDLINNKQFKKAAEVIDVLLDGDLSGGPSYFKNATGLDFYFNILITKDPPAFGYYSKFVQLDSSRMSIHVGNITYDEGTKVETFLQEDMYQSVKPLIEELLNTNLYKVLIYSGQLDIIVANTNTDNFLRHLSWVGAEKFASAERKIWRFGGDVAGYVKSAKSLTHLLVRRAGHIIPYDVPKQSFDMINRFTSGKAFA